MTAPIMSSRDLRAELRTVQAPGSPEVSALIKGAREFAENVATAVTSDIDAAIHRMENPWRDVSLRDRRGVFSANYAHAMVLPEVMAQTLDAHPELKQMDKGALNDLFETAVKAKLQALGFEVLYYRPNERIDQSDNRQLVGTTVVIRDPKLADELHDQLPLMQRIFNRPSSKYVVSNPGVGG